jgi:hypothetical protein
MAEIGGVRNSTTLAPRKSGALFVMPAIAPGFLAATTLLVGTPAPVVALYTGLAALAVGGMTAAAPNPVRAAMAAGVGGVLAGIAGVLSGGASVGVAILVGIGGAAVAAGSAVACARMAEKYNYSHRKTLGPVLGASVLGAAMTFGAGVHAPAPVVSPVPDSSLKTSSQGGGLNRDFQAAKNLTERHASQSIPRVDNGHRLQIG